MVFALSPGMPRLIPGQKIAQAMSITLKRGIQHGMYAMDCHGLVLEDFANGGGMISDTDV
jgi:hypothetical protein